MPRLPLAASLTAAALLCAPAAAGDDTASLRIDARTVERLQTATPAEAKWVLTRRAERACRLADARMLEERRMATTCVAVLSGAAQQRLPQGGPILVELNPGAAPVALP